MQASRTGEGSQTPSKGKTERHTLSSNIDINNLTLHRRTESRRKTVFKILPLATGNDKSDGLVGPCSSFRNSLVGTLPKKLCRSTALPRLPYQIRPWIFGLFVCCRDSKSQGQAYFTLHIIYIPSARVLSDRVIYGCSRRLHCWNHETSRPV